MLPKRLGLFETTSYWLGASRPAISPPPSTRRLMVQLHNSRWIRSVAFRLSITTVPPKHTHYMTEHMNRYYGFNVMPEPADSPDNWKGERLALKFSTTATQPTTLRVMQ